MPAVTILIPVKEPHHSKTRLSGLLNSSQRSKLTLNMLLRVIKASVSSSVVDIVVAGGTFNPLKQLIKERAFPSVRWVDVLGRDLNNDVELASAVIRNSGRAYIYIPGDVPFISRDDIEEIIKSSEDGKTIVFVASESDGGTNAMFVPPEITFKPHLGVDSLKKHCEYAERNTWAYRIIRPSGLALDLDTERDLEHCEEIESGFLDRLGALHEGMLE